MIVDTFFYMMKNSFDLIPDNLAGDTIFPSYPTLWAGQPGPHLFLDSNALLEIKTPRLVVIDDRGPTTCLSFSYNFVHAFVCSL